MAGIRKIDFIDKITLPIFAATMVWEHRVLQKRQLRELVDVNAVAPIDDGNPTPDQLVPLGYEKKDTAERKSCIRVRMYLASRSPSRLSPREDPNFQRYLSFHSRVALVDQGWDCRHQRGQLH